MKSFDLYATSLTLVCPAILAVACAKTDPGEVYWDTGYDPGYDTGADTQYDPGFDTGYDPSIEPTVDPSVDTVTDTSADTITDTAVDTGTCPETPCGLIPQCGCPAGQKCSLVGTARSCVAAGYGTRGSSCTADSDCAAGLICLELFTGEGASEAACYPFCSSETECPGDAAVCWEAFLGLTDRICTLGCNLVTSAGCPSGTKCLLLTLPAPYNMNITDCTADAGSGILGSFCTVESHCGPGYFCGSASGTDECIGYCTISPYDSCAFGCRQFVDASSMPVTLYFDGTSYGYCY